MAGNPVLEVHRSDVILCLFADPLVSPSRRSGTGYHLFEDDVCQVQIGRHCVTEASG
jgi:hypothetical protein